MAAPRRCRAVPDRSGRGWTDRAGPPAPPGHLPHHRCYVHPAAVRVPARRPGGFSQQVHSRPGGGGDAGAVPTEISKKVSGLPYGCGVDIENAVDDLDTGASFGVAGDPPSALSPSRAADFMTFPLLYRFRVIDPTPEPPPPAPARGTRVHAVLERLFDRPAAERTPAAAAGMLEPEWARLRDGDAGLGGLFCEAPEGARGGV